MAASCDVSAADLKPLSHQLHLATTTYQFPDTPWDAATAAAVAGNAALRPLANQRLLVWRAALHSLYYSLRHGQCNAFYVVPEVRPVIPAILPATMVLVKVVLLSVGCNFKLLGWLVIFALLPVRAFSSP